MIRRFLTRPPGVTRPKVVAVFCASRAELECAIRHVTTGSELPVWGWCAQPEPAPPGAHACTPASACIPEGCDRFFAGPGSLAGFRKALSRRWVALSIVAWTGPGTAWLYKLIPFTILPFRILVMNEARDFFDANPAALANHLRRRAKDASISAARRLWDWARCALPLGWSHIYRTSERVRDLFVLWRNFLWEVTLTAIASVAVHFHDTAKAVIAALGDRSPMLVSVSGPFPASESDFTEVILSGRAWPRRAVLRALSESSAEFVVFRGKDESAPVQGLIAEANRTGSFAAARQCARSAWRTCIVHKHPFRPLHAGEVTEVLAPASPLIVIRRRTLAELGCPFALTTGAALMLIFWKASAAGLRSIVVGHGDEVPDEPATALEDLELAVRVRISPTLTRVGPPRPASLRGNISWSPGHRKPMRGNVRVLVVSPYLPFPLSHGGAVRIYNLCRQMSSGADFTLACFREANETVCYEALHEVFREVYIVDADEKQLDPAVPAQVAEYRNTAMEGLVRHLCRESRMDLVQLEYTQLAEYREHTGSVPVLLVEHDITFTLHRQMVELTREIPAAREYQRWLAFETRALLNVHAVWTMSDRDRAVAVSSGAAPFSTEVIPNGVDLQRFKPSPLPGGSPTLLFVGSFRHGPNLLAFEVLRDSIMPEVWKSHPHAILHVIAGPNHVRMAETAGLQHLLEPDPRIVLEGFVEDVRPAYRDAHVVVIPLPVSAGTNIKVMEAMACGRPVVSTGAGCQGLGLTDGRELFVAPLDERFSKAIVTLLANPNLSARMGRDARETAEQRFGWDVIAAEALRSYASLMESTAGGAGHASASQASPRMVGSRSGRPS